MPLYMGTMGLKEVLTRLGAERSVKAAFPLEGVFYSKVIEEERGITDSSFGMPLINKAIEEVAKRKMTVCLFCDITFEPPSDHTMVMEDGCGNRVGHDVPANMKDAFKNDPDAVWIGDDFAMYPDRAESDEMWIIMLPQRIGMIGEDEGVKDAVLLYPATTTDIMLKKHFGVPTDDPGIASAILSFDPL